jgi:3-oxoacyl-[acyl-carrier protein] reductase
VFKLTDKIAIVTGASRGIGKSIAETLEKAGAQVMCVSRHLEDVQKIADNLGNGGSGAMGFACDVSDTKSVTSLVQSIIEKYHRIDILINNAGITKDVLIMRMSERDWDDVLNTNLKGAFNMTKAVSRTMMKKRTGRIINISSIIGLTGNPGQINYAASKAGLIGLTKTTAKEFASRNITANCIAPGYIETDMSNAINEKKKETLMKQIPLGRIGKPEDIASMVQFLSSDEAGFITGQTITVDGGMVL